MGKTRQTKTTHPGVDTYTLSTGTIINKEGHSEEWMGNFERNIKNWIQFPGESASEYLSDEEIEYIKNNMEDSSNNPDVPSGQLTRVELAYHFNNENLKVGDTLPSDVPFRSFSRTQDASAKWTQGELDDDAIYRTNGNVKHYNISKFDKVFEGEKESLVEIGKLKIDKITKFNHSDYGNDKTFTDTILKELGVPDSNIVVPYEHSVTIVDVSSTQ